MPTLIASLFILPAAAQTPAKPVVKQDQKTSVPLVPFNYAHGDDEGMRLICDALAATRSLSWAPNSWGTIHFAVPRKKLDAMVKWLVPRLMSSGQIMEVSSEGVFIRRSDSAKPEALGG